MCSTQHLSAVVRVQRGVECSGHIAQCLGWLCEQHHAEAKKPSEVRALLPCQGTCSAGGSGCWVHSEFAWESLVCVPTLGYELLRLP